jgi:hypothetical protein
MKRLTKRIDGKAAFVHGTCYDPQQVCDFLAAYEDTGLEPEEIKQMCALARLNSNIFDNDFGNHIAELIVAEQDGRLLVLPCKVGARFTLSQMVRSKKPDCWQSRQTYLTRHIPGIRPLSMRATSRLECALCAGRLGTDFISPAPRPRPL